MVNFILALILGLGSLFAPLATPVYAEESSEESVPPVWLQISPVSNRVTLTPSTELPYTFFVSNIGSSTFSYHAYVSPYSITDDDYDVSFSNDTNRTQITRWVKFVQDGQLVDEYKGTINPGDKQMVEYRITVPDDVPAGGQYATIFVQSDDAEGEAELSGSGIKTVSRVGLIVYGRTEGDTTEEAEIKEYNVPTFLTSGPISATSKVANNGNTDFEASYEFSVETIFGKVLYSKENSYNILPDTARRVNYEWEHTPAMGIFKVRYKVSALDATREETKIVLIMPIYMLIIMLILLTIFIIWLIILIRKRRERKSRLLV